MPLHTKYRVNTLDRMVGNETIINEIKTLINREKDTPHVWLFTGSPGCGKSTLAYIVSDLLGCPPKETNLDFREINASSEGGINTAREIQKTMIFHPMDKNNKCRIYFLEECHRASPDFWEGMKKPLEMPPDHVYFLMCTSESEKILANAAIKRRVHHFDVKRLNDKQILILVKRTLEEEGEEGVPDEVVNTIAELSDGSPGQALMHLDKIIDLDPEEMLDALRVNETTRKQVYDLSRALLNGTWNDVRQVLYDPKKKEFLLNEEAEAIRRMVLGYMQKVIVTQSSETATFARALLVLDCFSDTFFYTGKPGLTKACANIFV